MGCRYPLAAISWVVHGGGKPKAVWYAVAHKDDRNGKRHVKQAKRRTMGPNR